MHRHKLALEREEYITLRSGVHRYDQFSQFFRRFYIIPRNKTTNNIHVSEIIHANN